MLLESWRRAGKRRARMIAMMNSPVLSTFRGDVFQFQGLRNISVTGNGSPHQHSDTLLEKKKPAPKSRSRLRKVNKDHRLFGSPAVLFFEDPRLCVPRLPGVCPYREYELRELR